jgi:hypothetical protein
MGAVCVPSPPSGSSTIESAAVVGAANGDGTFQPLVYYLVPPEKSSIGTVSIPSANLDGDAKADLVLGIGGASPAMAVLINSTGLAPPPTPAAPTLLSPAQDATPTQPVAFDWTDVSVASSYRIQIDDSDKFSTPLVVDRMLTSSQFTAHAGRAPALVARAGHQLGRHGRLVVLGPPLHAPRRGAGGALDGVGESDERDRRDPPRRGRSP